MTPVQLQQDTVATRAADLRTLADGVLMPCFDGITAPEWLLRRVSGGLGGVCLFARNIGTPEQLRALTASLHARRPELVIAIDEEAGDVTRLDAATGSRFPGAAALGRADDVQLTEEIGRQVGRLLAAGGITLNFAPSADVAVDRSNPIIGTRSFGSDPDLVARHAAAFIVGQQSAGVAACVKHFPGHGDTAADSHLSVAVVATDRAGLDRVALPPFAAAIDAGVTAVMTGHLVVPVVDDLPASLSPRWTTQILREQLGFAGVVVTDALEMAAIAGSQGIARGAVLAVLAGADLLCLGGEDAGEVMLDDARDALVEAVLAGELPLPRLQEAAKRVRTLGPGPGTAGQNSSAAALEPQGPDGSTAGQGAVAARVAAMALDIAGPLPEPVEPVLVLRCNRAGSLAVGTVPWGLAATGAPVRELTLHAGDPLPGAEIDAAATIVLLTRDRHRFSWMTDTLAALRALRPDAVLVEMGSAAIDPSLAPAIATHGASMANAGAVVAALGLPAGGPQS